MTATGVPPETEAALKTHKGAAIYVLGPEDAVPETVFDALGKLGTVKRIAAGDAVSTAITFARYRDGDVRLVRRRPRARARVRERPSPPGRRRRGAAERARQVRAAAADGATPACSPEPLQNYLLDIQPGYDETTDPVRGVYNHGWIIGDESAIAAAVQARIDTLLEIQPVDTGAE